MISNPFRRKKKDPIAEARARVEAARDAALDAAATIRDSAGRVADALEETPVSGRRRIPVLGVLAAAGLGVAYAVRSRGSETEEIPYTPPTPVATPTPPPSASGEKADPGSKPAAGGAGPAEKAPTPESKEAEQPKPASKPEKAAAKPEPEAEADPKAETAESEEAKADA